MGSKPIRRSLAPPPAQSSQRAAAEAERLRAVALLADDRAGHLVPSIRHAAITTGEEEDGTLVVLRPPSVMQGDWRDPSDTTPNASRTPRRIRSARRANNLAWMLRRGTPLTADHLAAGELYELDFELASRGVYPGKPPPEVRCAPCAGDYARIEDRGRAFRQAQAIVGRMGSDLLRHVVLGREGAPPADLSSWATGRGLDRKIAVGALVFVLERLSEHYADRIKQRRRDEI